MKNNHWKYFRHLEIIWKIGEKFWEKVEFENLQIQKKLKTWGKIVNLEKRWKSRKNCKFGIFFQCRKNLEMLKKFEKNLEIFEKIWKFGKNKIGKLGKEIANLKKKPWKFGKICKFGRKLELWKIIQKFEKSMKNFQI